MSLKDNIAKKTEDITPKISIGDPKQIAKSDQTINTQFVREQRRESKKKDISKVGDKARNTFSIPTGQMTATGLEKAILVAGQGLLNAQFAIEGFFYGKFNATSEDPKYKQALAKGIVNLLDDLSNIDLCNILEYLINRIPGSKPFDPEAPPPSNVLGAAKYFVQMKAFKLQKSIDGFHSTYLESDSNDSKLKSIYGIINQIKDSFQEVFDTENQSALKDPRLLQAFPQIGQVNTFLEKNFSTLTAYTDYRQIPVEDIQKALALIEKVRTYTILIQGLNTPAAAISFVDSVFPNADIKEQIDKLEKIINPAKLTPFLKNTIETLKKVQSVCNVFVSFITLAQSIIRICILVVKALKIVIKFLKILPIPNQFTILGITNTLSGFCELLVRQTNQLLDRLSQVNTLLSLCASLVSAISVAIFDIIAKINRMLVNLEGCSNVDPELIKDLQLTRDGLENTANFFRNFADNYERNSRVENATFGDFTIQIVTEEVVDDAIRLRRRYGVAQDINGIIVASSSPTFASDNQIIINEVKFILSSKGYVKSDVNLLSLQEMNTMTESLNFLFDNNISLSDLETNNFDNGMDSGTNEDENDGLGLNAFVNKLQGGKKLRERMRKMMKKNSDQLQTDLKASGSGAKFDTSNLPGQQDDAKTKATEEKITKLKKEKDQLLEAIRTTKIEAINKVRRIRISMIDKEIAKLENE